MKTTLVPLGEVIDRLNSKSYESVLIRDSEFRRVVNLNRDFRKRMLELWMFVACDKGGEPLKKPRMTDPNNILLSHQDNLDFYNQDIKEYQQAQGRVIFKGFELTKGNIRHIVLNGIAYGTVFKDGSISWVYESIQDLENKVELLESEHKRLEP